MTLENVQLWIKEHDALLGWLGGVSVVMFIGSVVLAPVLIAKIPWNYFLMDEDRPETWSGHPAWVWTRRALQNLAGLLFILAGLAMLILPGQGILTLLLGVFLVRFPGKRELELWLVRRPGVLRSINWLRRQAKQRPLQLPEKKQQPQNITHDAQPEPPKGT